MVLLVIQQLACKNLTAKFLFFKLDKNLVFSFYKKNMTKKEKYIFSDRSGFTLIELLLVLVIIGILAGIIFVSVGNQRKKAKLNTVMQIAKGAHAITRDCNFRVGSINTPNKPKEPTNEICKNSKTVWFPITVSECVYAHNETGATDNKYEIICDSFSKKVSCGIQANGECEILDITEE